MPELEWLQPARADLLAIVDYISDDNPDAAQRLKDDSHGQHVHGAVLPGRNGPCDARGLFAGQSADSARPDRPTRSFSINRRLYGLFPPSIIL
ncbi:plasmid stabilization system [Xanthomonas fragariae LMG 25863]|nr:plasmid stabilization system [Xanthomonas fragariae LMG 25863]